MPPKTVENKRVLITGAASGIGRATAIASARRNARLLLTDINDAPLQSVAAEIRAAGGTVDYAKALDISDHAAVAAMADEIHAAYDSVYIVMNIAGIAVWGTVETLSHDQWRRVVDVNLMGPIHVIECFVPPMIRARRGGHLVNVSSAAGLLGLPWHAPYSAAKFGLRGVSEVLRFDLRRHGIGVTLVCPGAVKTPLVGTVEIVGVDRDHPAWRKLTKRFEAHATSPDDVATKIIQAVKQGRYLVLTSRDIQLAYWLQRTFAPGYELVMRVANDRLVAAATRSRR